MAMLKYRLLLVVFGILLSACKSAEIATEDVPTATMLPYRAATVTHQPTPAEADGTASGPIGPTPTPFVHIVQQGETLLGIALRYGVALEDLILVNPGIDPGFLTIGKQLRIPGEEGEALDTLLPTPTPVPVELSSVVCYESASGALACLLEARNNEAGIVRGLSVVVRLFDGGGEEIGVQLANAPLELLGPEKSLPLSVTFPPAAAGYSYATAHVQAAIRLPSSDAEANSIGVTIRPDIEILNARMARVVGIIDPGQASIVPGGLIRILGIVRSAEGVLAGYQILDLDLPGEMGNSITFSLDIFSLGPEIGSVEVTGQARSSQ